MCNACMRSLNEIIDSGAHNGTKGMASEFEKLVMMQRKLVRLEEGGLAAQGPHFQKAHSQDSR